MKLKIFDNLVQTRYETLIKNIKSNSNSFYDSYLDLLEGTIKFILDSSEISYNKSSTCGNILKEKDVNEFLLKKLFLDEYTINKLPDYIKKCNDHKHKKEKKLSIDSIINYLRVYFNLINYYYNFINEEKIIYDENYFVSIFKEFEIINSEYKNEIIVLKNKITSLYKQQKITVFPTGILSMCTYCLHSKTLLHILLLNRYAATAAKSLQSCPTLCDPRNASPPGSPIPGILQARTLEWIAISFSNA